MTKSIISISVIILGLIVFAVKFTPQIGQDTPLKYSYTKDFTAKVGDDKTLIPKLELTKGDASIIITPQNYGTLTSKFEGEKIKYISSDKEYHFYPTDKGYENDTILKSKPSSDTLYYDFQTNLNLVKIEIACIYYSSSTPCVKIYEYQAKPQVETNNYSGASGYVGSPYFKIYAPKITDNAGKTTWGVMDISNGVMSIKIDQNFLDTASYPITVDPLQEYFNTGDNASSSPNGALEGQTWTTTSAYDLYSVKILVYRVNSPGTVNFNVYATSGGVPTGDPLSSTTFNGNSLTTDTAGEWKEIVLPSPIALTDATMYAWAVAEQSTAGGTIRLRLDNTSPPYTGGTLVYLAPPWTAVSGTDYLFEIWSAAEGDEGWEFYDSD